MKHLIVTLAAAWIAGGYVPPAESDYRAFFAEAPAPVLRRTFVLAETATTAIWKIAAAGLVDAYVNGECVTPTALPGWTDFACRVLVYDYDVAKLLKKGENVLELRVGNGWYNLLPMKMWGRFNLRENLAQGTSASGWLDTPKGRLAVSWRMVEGRMKVETKVPDGITVLKTGNP